MAGPSIVPYIRYEDAPAMIGWLEEAFGFERRAYYEEGDRVVHAELTFRGGIVMVASTHDDDPTSAQTPRQLGGRSTGGFYVVVDDPDGHCAQARAAGAEIVTEPHEQDYGSRDYVARDPEGFTWSFGTYRPQP